MHRRAILGGLAALAAWPARSDGDLIGLMAGQLVMAGISGRRPTDAGIRDAAAQIASGALGGVLLLSRNIEGPAQLRRLTAYLSASGRPFIAVDQEGGRVARLRPSSGFSRWESPRSVAARLGPEGARDYYAPRARVLARLGINVNLGPVVDLDMGRASPVIGRLGRAFSADADEVAQAALGFVEAHRAAGIATALKHFPGHGSAPADSHLILPEVSGTWHEAELGPFRALVGQDAADMIMTAHLAHPRFSDAPGVPSSLSARTHAAIREMGFKGVVVTDDLQMRAIADLHGPEEAAIRALGAGADLVIVAASERADRAIGPRVSGAIAGAVRAGRLGEAALARSYLAVTALKDRIGL